MPETPLILIVDDEALVRDSLDTLLRSIGYAVRTFPTVQDLTEDWLGRANCLILDVRLPITSGLEFQQRLVEKGHLVPIVFVTGHGDIPMSVQAMKAGAIDFLPKPFREQDMLDAVAAAVDQSMASVAETSGTEIRARFEAMSEREQRIMALATSGLLNKQIAGMLGLSEITIKIQRAKISRKMQAKTFADLARMAETLGLPRQVLSGH